MTTIRGTSRREECEIIITRAITVIITISWKIYNNALSISNNSNSSCRSQRQRWIAATAGGGSCSCCFEVEVVMLPIWFVCWRLFFFYLERLRSRWWWLWWSPIVPRSLKAHSVSFVWWISFRCYFLLCCKYFLVFTCLGWGLFSYLHLRLHCSGTCIYSYTCTCYNSN